MMRTSGMKSAGRAHLPVGSWECPFGHCNRYKTECRGHLPLQEVDTPTVVSTHSSLNHRQTIRSQATLFKMSPSMSTIYRLVAFIGLAAAAPKDPACGAPTTTQIVTSIVPVETTVPTLCVDYVNECGIMYGGCFASTSGMPWPSFSNPGCPTTVTNSPTITSLPTTTDFITTAVPTICVDTVNSCGQTYGGCFPSTFPFPTFADPGCPTITTTVQTEIPVYTGVPTICEDHVNACGRTYGGCYASTSPAPVFTDPGCPSLTTVVVTVPTNL